MTLIDWATGFQRQWRKNHLASTVSVVHSGGTLSNLKATKIDPSQSINGEGVKVKTNHFIFQFDAEDVSSVFWKSGIKIKTSTKTYEVIIDRNREVYYDDPTEKTLNVPAKKVS